MRLKITKTKSATNYYIIKDIKKNGKRSTAIYERLGTEKEILKRSNGEDIFSWIEKYLDKLNKNSASNDVIVKYSPQKIIEKDTQKLFNCGYLFLEKIYYDLKINKICDNIANKYSFKYDLNNILSRLLYGRIIFPSSKLATYNLSQKFIEQPNFELQHIYRALEVIAKENEFIQAELYKNSLKKAKRNTGVLYLDKINQNDFKRFITKTSVTKDGEVAEKKILLLNTNQIEKEQIYDGFYGVCTNLEDNAEEIIKVNQRRWEIEESFRIMKSEFKARPVYLSRDDRIIAHFTTCFLSLVLHRYLEKELNEKYTATEIIDTLRNMNLTKNCDEGYIPSYTRTDITDCLHEKFNFRTDYEIMKNIEIKKILNFIKK